MLDDLFFFLSKKIFNESSDCRCCPGCIAWWMVVICDSVFCFWLLWSILSSSRSYLTSSMSSPSDELLIVLYCELRLRSIRRKLPTAKMVRRCRWNIPWYKASLSVFRSSTSTDDVSDVWCGNRATNINNIQLITHTS